VKTAPGATTAAPTDNYDVYIKDTTYPTLSLLGTSLENRDEANTELVVPSAPVPVYYGTATLVVAAAGDANTGTVYLYVSVP
jgi:hypothetical protein